MGYDLFVLGYFGFGNAGDDSLGRAIVSELEEHFDGDIGVSVGNHPLFDSDNIDLVSLSPLSVFWTVLKSDVVVVTGGTHFHDRGTRTISRLKVFVFYFLVSVLARLSRTQLYLVGHGIGPIERPLFRALAKGILSLATVVTVRDPDSQKRANEFVNSELTFDLAALLLPEISPAKNEEEVLGISLTPGFDRYFDRPESDRQLVTDLAKSIEDSEWSSVKIFVFHTGSTESDVDISNYLASELDTTNVDVVRYEDSPVQFINEIGSVSAFVGMRFHSLVFAYLAEVPTAAISYHLKCRQFQQYVGRADEATLDMEKATPQKLGNLLSGLASNTDRYEATMSRNTAYDLAAKNKVYLPLCEASQ